MTRAMRLSASAVVLAMPRAIIPSKIERILRKIRPSDEIPRSKNRLPDPLRSAKLNLVASNLGPLRIFRHVRVWHKADMRRRPEDVRYRGQSRHPVVFDFWPFQRSL